MLYHAASFFKYSWSVLNVVHYVSFRIISALLCSLIISFLFGSKFITTSQRFFRSKPRDWTPENHQLKGAMPTMGGLFILCVVLINTLLWCNLTNIYIWIGLFCIVGFGLIGLIDDWYKIKYKKGISARLKFFLQIGVACATALALYGTGFSSQIAFPFLKNLHPDVGPFYLFWVVLILVGASNAVNLTDGLDGLAIGSLIPNFGTFVLICFVAGNYKIAHYLDILYAPCAEIAVMGATLLGASIGFLWYNTYPAQIFMGDVGSLALGAALAFMALMSKQEMLLAVSGGLFVVEALSVILQVFSFKYLGKRCFRMAPIHHHFELMGWQESKITVRFGIISLILCLLALITLKIR